MKTILLSLIYYLNFVAYADPAPAPAEDTTKIWTIHGQNTVADQSKLF